MKKILTCFCFTDIHNMQAMLDLPTTLRKSAYVAAKNAVNEFGKADITVIGGDNISDYPYWDKSCSLPKKNFLDIKDKLTKCFAKTAYNERVMYVSGNNDMILGDIGCAENKPYNTTDFYFSGPMNKTLGILPESECFTVKAIEKPEENPYLDAFHYVINGIDFIGINIDPNTAFNSHEGYYTDETLNWVKNKLDEIDPDGSKPVFVVGHLSAIYYENRKWTETMVNGNPKLFYKVLSGHKNLFYLYGHMHGEGYVYKDFTSPAIVHMDKNFSPISPNFENENSLSYDDYDFTLVHMGGLRPFDWNENFEKDGLFGYGGLKEKTYYPQTGTAKLAQYLVFELFEDRVVFHIRNAGNKAGYSTKDIPVPYTVYLK